jgi:hypothetical protein
MEIGPAGPGEVGKERSESLSLDLAFRNEISHACGVGYGAAARHRLSC